MDSALYQAVATGSPPAHQRSFRAASSLNLMLRGWISRSAGVSVVGILASLGEPRSLFAPMAGLSIFDQIERGAEELAIGQDPGDGRCKKDLGQGTCDPG